MSNGTVIVAGCSKMYIRSWRTSTTTSRHCGLEFASLQAENNGPFLWCFQKYWDVNQSVSTAFLSSIFILARLPQQVNKPFNKGCPFLCVHGGLKKWGPGGPKSWGFKPLTLMFLPPKFKATIVVLKLSEQDSPDIWKSTVKITLLRINQSLVA